MDLSAKIDEMATALLVEPAHFLVDVIISGNRVQKKVIVILDGDQGVTVEDCAQLSRALADKLDEAELIPEKYTLEVSTPGVDFPLKLKRQYRKNLGRTLRVTLKDHGELKGKLVNASEDSIELEIEEGKGKKKEVKIMDVPFDGIDKAVVQISFK